MIEADRDNCKIYATTARLHASPAHHVARSGIFVTADGVAPALNSEVSILQLAQGPDIVLVREDGHVDPACEGIADSNIAGSSLLMASLESQEPSGKPLSTPLGLSLAKPSQRSRQSFYADDPSGGVRQAHPERKSNIFSRTIQGGRPC